MNDSILTSIKKMLGIPEEHEQFDMDIIIHINSVLMTLTQIGVGPTGGFLISDKKATWASFINNGVNVVSWTGMTDLNLAAVKSYMYIKVKLLFDPPQSSFVIESMNKQAAEFEWRLNVEADTK